MAIETATAEWLERNHPEGYKQGRTFFKRCPTCEEWSPCRVREVFIAFDLCIRRRVVVRPYIADLIPKWWDGLSKRSMEK